jgi:manganese efflux pump family protein
MAMPVIGLLVGHVLGHAIGMAADYVAAAALFALGIWMLVSEEQDEAGKVSALTANNGLALVTLGVSISLDELAMGFTIGLLHLPIALAVILIGAQAFIVAQLGLRLGSRLSEAAREGAEKIAGLALIGLGLLILIQKLA